jgi:hypothetical protein
VDSARACGLGRSLPGGHWSVVLSGCVSRSNARVKLRRRRVGAMRRVGALRAFVSFNDSLGSRTHAAPHAITATRSRTRR